MSARPELEEAFRNAQLVLFSARALAAFEAQRDDPPIASVVQAAAKPFNLRQPALPLQQGVVLSALDVCFVSLWEQLDDEQKLAVAARFEERFALATRVELVRRSPSRDASTKELLHAMRNALSRGRVRITDERFVFVDNEAEFSLPCNDAGASAEALFFLVQDLCYPSPLTPEEDAGLRSALDSVERGDRRSASDVRARIAASREALSHSPGTATP